jgi:hypothetical protein
MREVMLILLFVASSAIAVWFSVDFGSLLLALKTYDIIAESTEWRYSIPDSGTQSQHHNNIVFQQHHNQRAKHHAICLIQNRLQSPHHFFLLMLLFRDKARLCITAAHC